jgi:glycosyltransferase involved in cell wall biosynthesis
MKIAVVHDWLTSFRGGEIVLDAILQAYPNADLFTLFHLPGKTNDRIENRKIITPFTNKLPFRASKYRYYLPLFPMAIESLSFKGYDLIISSSHCVAKGIIPHPNSIHISYIHTPMRYVWDMQYDYFPKTGIFSLFIDYISNYLRMWDVTSSTRVDEYLCNSRFVEKRINKYYRRDAKVVFPPCVPNDFQVQFEKKEDFYIMVSAFAPYKKIDIAIEAFRQNGKQLKIFGSGQYEKQLKKNLPSNVKIYSGYSRKDILPEWKKARGFVFPGVEDFGIAPVESQWFGTPVLAFSEGGALETVVEGKTGAFFSEQTPESLNSAISRLESVPLDAKTFENHLSQFTLEKFINEIRSSVDRHK